MSLTANSISVISGSWTPTSLNIFWNAGITKFMIPARIPTATTVTTIG